MLFKGSSIDGIKIKDIIHDCENFNICRTIINDLILIVNSSLYEQWLNDHLIYDVNPFKKININNKNFYYVKSEKPFHISMVRDTGVSFSKKSILNFVFSLTQMRKVTNISLYDGIFIEEYNYIFPTYTQGDFSDDALLGYFFSAREYQHFTDSNLRCLTALDHKGFIQVAKMMNFKIKTDVDEDIEKSQSKNISGKFTLIGRPELEKFFNEHIVNILSEPERYKKLGIDFPSSVILYGPPGCGKTYAVDRLVEFLKLPKYEINSSSVASPYIHDTSRKVSGIFEAAIKSAPSIVVIDEMESYLSDRNAVGDTYHTEEVAEFLRQIQSANQKHVLVIAMTNLINKIDPAILRKGRFDHHIEVGLPSKEEIESLLKHLFKKISVVKEVNVVEIATKMQGRNLADVTFVIKEAGLISGQAGLEEISKESIDKALDLLPKENELRKIGFGD